MAGGSGSRPLARPLGVGAGHCWTGRLQGSQDLCCPDGLLIICPWAVCLGGNWNMGPRCCLAPDSDSWVAPSGCYYIRGGDAGCACWFQEENKETVVEGRKKGWTQPCPWAGGRQSLGWLLHCQGCPRADMRVRPHQEGMRHHKSKRGGGLPVLQLRTFALSCHICRRHWEGSTSAKSGQAPLLLLDHHQALPEATEGFIPLGTVQFSQTHISTGASSCSQPRISLLA